MKLKDFFAVQKPTYEPAPPELAALLREAYAKLKRAHGQEPTDEELERATLIRPATGLYQEYRYHFPGPHACAFWLRYRVLDLLGVQLPRRWQMYWNLRGHGFSNREALRKVVFHYAQYVSSLLKMQEDNTAHSGIEYVMGVEVAGEDDLDD